MLTPRSIVSEVVFPGILRPYPERSGVDTPSCYILITQHAVDCLNPPYILVAHSWSGINARWFVNHYPDEIAGMVLVDVVHEDKYEHFEKVLSEEKASCMWLFVKDPSKNDESIDCIACIEQVRSKQNTFDFPLIVLTRATDSDELSKIETNLQAKLLKLSEKSKQHFSRYNNHFIQNSET